MSSLALLAAVALLGLIIQSSTATAASCRKGYFPIASATGTGNADACRRLNVAAYNTFCRGAGEDGKGFFPIRTRPAFEACEKELTNLLVPRCKDRVTELAPGIYCVRIPKEAKPERGVSGPIKPKANPQKEPIRLPSARREQQRPMGYDAPVPGACRITGGLC